MKVCECRSFPPPERFERLLNKVHVCTCERDRALACALNQCAREGEGGHTLCIPIKSTRSDDVTGFLNEFELSSGMASDRIFCAACTTTGDAKGSTYTQSKEWEPLVDTCLLAVRIVSCEQPMANNLLCS
jgi:hypothetical protein